MLSPLDMIRSLGLLVMQSLSQLQESPSDSVRDSIHHRCGCAAMSPKGASDCQSYKVQSLNAPTCSVVCL